MARSTYIYVLIDEASGDTIGVFTVKHEMMKVRDRQEGHTYYLRYRDNDPFGPVATCFVDCDKSKAV